MAVTGQVSDLMSDHRVQPSARLFRGPGIEAGKTYDGRPRASARIAEHGYAPGGCQRPPRDKDTRHLARGSQGS